MKTLSRNRSYRLTLGIIAGLIVGLGFTSVSQAERLSLSGLKNEINAVDTRVQSIEAVVCGGADIADCASNISPSVVERLLALEAEKQELQDALCSLAQQTGSTVPGCGPIAGDLRLVAGAAANEGRLELFFNNQWGTVCDDRWDINDATVACNQLGYPGAAAALYTFNVVDGTGPILLDDVQCLGSEANLLDCIHRQPTGSHNCSHFEDAGARCNPIP